MAVIGYARVSTADQNMALQLNALHEAGVDRVFRDQGVSGSTSARPGLDACLDHLREGDVLAVWKLDRLGRNTKHLLEIVEDLTQRGVGLRTLTGYAIDTSTPHGKLALHMFAALAEYERALIQERIMAGIAAARARGRKGGRPHKLSPDQQQTARDMAHAEIPITTIAKTLGCSRHTVYKCLVLVAVE